VVQDSIKLGAELSVTAGPVSRFADGTTDAQLHAEILSYSRSRGLYAGASLDGAVCKQDEGDNQKVCGRRVTEKGILIDGTVPSPRAAQRLDGTLTKYSPSGGRTFARLQAIYGEHCKTSKENNHRARRNKGLAREFQAAPRSGKTKHEQIVNCCTRPVCLTDVQRWLVCIFRPDA
jgi:hypothetical protein